MMSHTQDNNGQELVHEILKFRTQTNQEFSLFARPHCTPHSNIYNKAPSTPHNVEWWFIIIIKIYYDDRFAKEEGTDLL